MSGGHFDHAYWGVERLAERLGEALAAADEYALTQQERQLMARVAALTALTAQAARAIEWRFSGDTGPERTAELLTALLLELDRAAWIDAAQRLPAAGVPVIARYVNQLGRERRVRAKWVPAKTLEASPDYAEDWGEYDEESDAYYCPEGWYECIDNWDELSAVFISNVTITHWAPLPPVLDDLSEEQPS